MPDSADAFTTERRLPPAIPTPGASSGDAEAKKTSSDFALATAGIGDSLRGKFDASSLRVGDGVACVYTGERSGVPGEGREPELRRAGVDRACIQTQKG